MSLLSLAKLEWVTSVVAQDYLITTNFFTFIDTLRTIMAKTQRMVFSVRST